MDHRGRIARLRVLPDRAPGIKPSEAEGVVNVHRPQRVGIGEVFDKQHDVEQMFPKGIGQPAQSFKRERFDVLRGRREARRLTGLRHDCHISAKRRQGIET